MLTEKMGSREEQSNLHTLFMQAPGFMAMLSGPQHVFDFSNHAHNALIGNREILGKPIREALPEIEGQGFFEILDQMYATGEAYTAKDAEVSIRRQEGGAMENIFVNFVFQPIRKHDLTTGIFIQGADVTERHRAEEALELTQSRLREGMLAARMAVWDWDLVSDEITFSRNVTEIFGPQSDQLRKPWALIHPDDLDLLRKAKEEAINGDGHYAATVRVLATPANQQMWIDVRGKLVRNESGEFATIRGVILDVTQRKQAEESLLHSDKRKDDFLAMLAHELRNPLAPISTGAELLKMYAGDDKRIKQTAEMISRQVLHMTALVNDLVDVSRVTRGLVVIQNEVVNANMVVLHAFEQVRPLIESQNHVLRTRTDEKPAFVKGDQMRLIQVISNLLNNAAKYTPKGGHISLEVKVINDQVKIIVADDGSGITPSLLPRIFDLFTQGDRTSDRSQGGLGIGLALVKSIVSLHGGKVEAQSAGQDRGSAFTVTLPLFIANGVVKKQEGRETKPCEKPRRIMIVDDNADAAKIQAVLLRTEGHEVMVREDAAGALEGARSYMPDVFILDIGLPDMSGLELAGQLRRQMGDHDVKFIALTGYGQPQDKVLSKQAGFDHHFVKPVNSHELLKVLDEC